MLATPGDATLYDPESIGTRTGVGFRIGTRRVQVRLGGVVRVRRVHKARHSGGIMPWEPKRMGRLLRVRLEVEAEPRRTSVHRRVIPNRVERKREEAVDDDVVRPLQERDGADKRRILGEKRLLAAVGAPLDANADYVRPAGHVRPSVSVDARGIKAKRRSEPPPRLIRSVNSSVVAMITDGAASPPDVARLARVPGRPSRTNEPHGRPANNPCFDVRQGPGERQRDQLVSEHGGRSSVPSR